MIKKGLVSFHSTAGTENRRTILLQGCEAAGSMDAGSPQTRLVFTVKCSTKKQRFVRSKKVWLPISSRIQQKTCHKSYSHCISAFVYPAIRTRADATAAVSLWARVRVGMWLGTEPREARKVSPGERETLTVLFSALTLGLSSSFSALVSVLVSASAVLIGRASDDVVAVVAIDLV